MVGSGRYLPRSSGSGRRYSHFRSPVAASRACVEVGRIREEHRCRRARAASPPACRVHAAGPHQLQLLHVARVDLLQRAVAPAGLVPAPHQPAAEGSGLLQHRVRDGSNADRNGQRCTAARRPAAVPLSPRRHSAPANSAAAMAAPSRIRTGHDYSCFTTAPAHRVICGMRHELVTIRWQRSGQRADSGASSQETRVGCPPRPAREAGNRSDRHARLAGCRTAHQQLRHATTPLRSALVELSARKASCGPVSRCSTRSAPNTVFDGLHEAQTRIVAEYFEAEQRVQRGEPRDGAGPVLPAMIQIDVPELASRHRGSRSYAAPSSEPRRRKRRCPGNVRRRRPYGAGRPAALRRPGCTQGQGCAGGQRHCRHRASLQKQSSIEHHSSPVEPSSYFALRARYAAMSVHLGCPRFPSCGRTACLPCRDGSPA